MSLSFLFLGDHVPLYKNNMYLAVSFLFLTFAPPYSILNLFIILTGTLNMQVAFGLFTEEQEESVVSTLMELFCSAHTKVSNVCTFSKTERNCFHSSAY